MSPTNKVSEGKRPSIRDYLIDKFRFIHLRLMKHYNASQETVDLTNLQGAAQTFIEDLPLAIFFASLDGRFLYGNKRAEELSGYRREEIIGKTYFETDFVGINDLIKIAALYASHAFDRNLGPYRFTLRKKNGARVKVELLAQLVAFGASKSKIIISIVREVDEPRPQADEPNEEAELRRHLSQLNKGMSPIAICSVCKNVQAAETEWIPIEYFLYKQLEIEFAHGLCPSCLEKRSMGKA